MSGLYIHIPFCASRCVYCGFYSTTRLSFRQQYVDAMCREMNLLPFKPRISTIYLGGGTPSQLTHDQLAQLFDHIYNNVYEVDTDAEVTMECNPDDIRPGMFDGLPVNRVSMGAQTFSDTRLRFLRRRHTASQVVKAVEILRADGISNISIDLMFGFPEETLEEWKDDIRQALNLRPEHISAYGLMYEEGTPLYSMLESGEIDEADEELSLAMYDTLVNMMTEAGYEHYEISNFARLDEGNGISRHSCNVSPLRSRHNSSYWHDVPYIGIGAGAHSYYGGKRHWNPDNIDKYVAAIDKGRLPYEEETIDQRTHYDDMVTTALRTREGIDLSALADDQKEYLLDCASDYMVRGLLAVDGSHIHLTRKGINISNQIMSDLMWV